MLKKSNIRDHRIKQNFRTHKRTLNHLPKLAKWFICVVSTLMYVWLRVRLQTKWFLVQIPLLSLKLQKSSVLSKVFLDIHATIECRFTLKCIHDIIIAYSQMCRADKYSQHSSIIWPVWLIGWLFVYELKGYGFEFRWWYSLWIFGYSTQVVIQFCSYASQ